MKTQGRDRAFRAMDLISAALGGEAQVQLSTCVPSQKLGHCQRGEGTHQSLSAQHFPAAEMIHPMEHSNGGMGDAFLHTALATMGINSFLL